MRAGNVIGGGDFAPDRILPDCIRSAMAGEEIVLRNPYSVRPYQHVLEPLMAYLLVAKRQMEDAHIAGSYNIGPDACDCIATRGERIFFVRHGERVLCGRIIVSTMLRMRRIACAWIICKSKKP